MDVERMAYPRYVKLTEGERGGLRKLTDAMARQQATKEWLAVETGFSLNSIKKYLNGNRTYSGKLQAIFDALNLTLNDTDWKYETSAVRSPREEMPPELDEIPEPYKTLVFTDLEESTKQWEAQGNPFYQYVLKHDALLVQWAEWYDGEVVKGTGDGFFFAFDRAEKAVQFAIAVQQELPKQEWQNDLTPKIRVRIGMRTGRVIFNEQRSDFFNNSKPQSPPPLGAGIQRLPV